jgi:hypothetical protein
MAGSFLDALAVNTAGGTSTRPGDVKMR